MRLSPGSFGRWAIACAAVGTTLLLAATPLMARADATSGQTGGPSDGAALRIVFERGRHLWVAATDGTDLELLTRWGRDPAVSADGRLIAFTRDGSIWVVARDGSGQRRLTSGSDDNSPAWAPDGSTMYFSRRNVGSTSYSNYTYAYSIYRMRADGSGVTQVTRPPLSDHGTCHSGASVAPSGRVIAYASFGDCDHGVDVGIEATDPDGKRVRLDQFDLRYGAFDPTWSPDGRRLAVALDWFDGGPAGVAIASAGSATKRIYRRAASRLAWSPDGKWIAFARGSGSGRIWIVRPDGSGLRRVTSRRYDTSPAWLPAPSQ